MANALTSNPVYIDTAAGSTLSGLRSIHLIQWIDDNNDLADGDDLSITLNGVTIAIKNNIGSDVGFINTVAFQVGPFSRPIVAKDFVCNVIDHGILLVWLI